MYKAYYDLYPKLYAVGDSEEEALKILNDLALNPTVGMQYLKTLGIHALGNPVVEKIRFIVETNYHPLVKGYSSISEADAFNDFRLKAEAHQIQFEEFIEESLGLTLDESIDQIGSDGTLQEIMQRGLYGKLRITEV